MPCKNKRTKSRKKFAFWYCFSVMEWAHIVVFSVLLYACDLLSKKAIAYFCCIRSSSQKQTQTETQTQHENARWCFLHSAVNAYICYRIIPRLLLFFDENGEPVEFITSTFYVHDDLVYVLILHLYHVCMFTCCRMDLLHHIVFVGVACLSCLYTVSYTHLTLQTKS